MKTTWMSLNGAAMLIALIAWSAPAQQTFADLTPQSVRCKWGSVAANHSGAQSGKAQFNLLQAALRAGRSPCELFTAERLPGTSGKSDRFSGAEFFEFGAAAKSEHYEFAKETKPTQAKAPDQSATEAQELAKKLSNPVASLISLPMQSNFDFGLGIDFVVKGVMIGGFALVAVPAEYRVTGVKTFIVSYEGIVYEKDLGPNSLNIVEKMELYNPDQTWRRTDDEW